MALTGEQTFRGLTISNAYVSEENGEYKVDEEKMEEKMNTKE